MPGSKNAYDFAHHFLGAELRAKVLFRGLKKLTWRWTACQKQGCCLLALRTPKTLLFGAGKDVVLALKRHIWRWAEKIVPDFGAGERLGVYTYTYTYTYTYPEARSCQKLALDGFGAETKYLALRQRFWR